MKRGNYRPENIVYKDTVISVHETRCYIGLCSTQFRFRYANHKKYFKCGICKNEIELSKFICGLKHKNLDHKITWEVWEVIKRAQPIIDANNPICRPCIKKSVVVVFAQKDDGYLNKKSEFMST